MQLQSTRNQVYNLSQMLKDTSNQCQISQNLLNINEYESEILICIGNMIVCEQSKLNQQYLQSLYDKDYYRFTSSLFNIIIKSYLNKNIDFNSRQRNIQYTLQYIRHFTNQQKARMSLLINQFTAVYRLLCITSRKQLVVDCFRTYLNKRNHNFYVRQYFQTVSTKLIQQIQMGNADQIGLMLFVETLQNLIKLTQFQPGTRRQSIKIIQSIINTYAQVKPANIPDYLWISAITIFSRYTNFDPKLTFVFQVMLKNHNTIKMKSLIDMLSIYNKIHYRVQSAQYLYMILRLQMERISNWQFLYLLDQEGGVEAAEIMMKNIHYLISDIQSIRKNSYKPQMRDMVQYLHSGQFWFNCIVNSIKILQAYQGQQTQLSTILIQIIQQLTQIFQDPVILQQLIISLKDKLKQQYLFCLLAAMPKFIMQIFQADQIINQFCKVLPNRIGKQINSLNQNMYKLQLFIKFVIRYVHVHHYLESQTINQNIRQFWEYIISFQISQFTFQELTQYGQKDLKKYNNNLVKLRAYGLSILTRFLKYQTDPTIYSATPILQQCCFTFRKMTIIEAQDTQIITSIINQAIAQLCLVSKYKSILAQGVIALFQQYLFKNNDIQTSLRIFLCQQFLKILYQSYECDFQQNPQLFDSRILAILGKCMMGKNKAIQDQVCELVLKILVSINLAMLSKSIQRQKAEYILGQIYKIGIYQYIRSCLKNGEEEALYCQIMMETLIHQKGAKMIQQILIDVCSDSQAIQKILLTDIVWQALVILYDIENAYVVQKKIKQNADAIRADSIQLLFQKMNIDQQNQYKQKIKNKKRRVNWSYLPQVRKVIVAGSAVCTIVQNKLNQI